MKWLIETFDWWYAGEVLFKTFFLLFADGTTYAYSLKRAPFKVLTNDRTQV